MTYRTRIKYTAKQKDEMWDRWQRGESLEQLRAMYNIYRKNLCPLGYRIDTDDDLERARQYLRDTLIV